MAVRSSMSDLITYSKRLISQTDASSPYTEQQIQDVLDQHRTHFDFVLLDHDNQYNFYYTRAYNRVSLALPDSLSYGEGNLPQVAVPDFSLYTQVGFFESDIALYNGRDTSNTAHTPDDSNLYDGTFIFSTAPDTDLYMFGKGYNVWAGAADMLLETPDFGRLPLKAESRGQVSQTISWDDKIKMYYQRGAKLNRRISKLLRA